MDSEDLYNLNRFVHAQDATYQQALVELHAGQKRTHWMWYVFPQFVGLSSSNTALKFAIKSLAEADAYLSHAVLGPRLLECCEAIIGLDGVSATDIFGTPDDLKLRSCVTLFAQVSSDNSILQRVLEKYFNGKPDELTLNLIDS